MTFTAALGLALVVLCAGLNRARGDDRWMPTWLPGRALWYVAPVVALAALLVQPWQSAALVGLAYLIWAIPPWGLWFDVGRLVDTHTPFEDGAAGVFERAIATVSFGSDHFAFFLRNLVIFAGLAPLVPWPLAAGISLIFAAAVVGIYEAAWRFHRRNPIWLAELATGALWGLIIILL